jgi:hypothetical protein
MQYAANSRSQTFEVLEILQDMLRAWQNPGLPSPCERESILLD